MEEAATGDEALMEKYLGTGELTVEEIRKGLCERVVQGDLSPVFCCSALDNRGVKEVLDEVVDILPSPLDVAPIKGTSTNGGGEVVCAPDAAAPTAALVFKTLSEQHLGDLSLVRVYSGRLEAGKELMNTTRNRAEKMSTLYHLVGKERLDCTGPRRRHRRRGQAQGDPHRRHPGRQVASGRPARPTSPARSRRSASTPRTRATRRRWRRAWRACTRRTRPSASSSRPARRRRWSTAWATCSSRSWSTA